jgi:DNA-binding transcriptional regulator YdaS (Cro superfamily)
MSPLHRAVQIVGSQAKLARACAVAQGHVAMWVIRQKVPADKVLKIEQATAGKVTRHELRSDIFGPPPLTRKRVKKS